MLTFVKWKQEQIQTRIRSGVQHYGPLQISFRLLLLMKGLYPSQKPRMPQTSHPQQEIIRKMLDGFF